MTAQMGWLRHVLTVLSVIIFILGCVLIGYMAWVLATSVTVSKFLDGSLVFTYVVISLGFILFFSGLIGWVGGASESPCLLKLFLLCMVVSVIAEIGGIISLHVVNTEFEDILQYGWKEVNQGTRNIIQQKMDCCGFEGPKEFAFNNEPIDETCYEDVIGTNSGLATKSDDLAPSKKMKQTGCGSKLFKWFADNKLTWVSILASIGALQILCIGISIFILTRVNKIKKLRKSRTASRRRLYDSSSSSNGSHEYRHRI